jgi:MYXO-CTERM domain-containing protein
MNLRPLRSAIFVLALAIGVPAAANAQETRSPVTADDRDDGFDLGWLGLLGLAGLFGLKRRDDPIRDRDRLATTTR